MIPSPPSFQTMIALFANDPKRRSMTSVAAGSLPPPEPDSAALSQDVEKALMFHRLSSHGGNGLLSRKSKCAQRGY